MASWTLTGDAAYPIFASKNYINQDGIDYGVFTATEMSALISRVIDGDPFSYWAGSSEDDTIEVTLTFSFYDGSLIIARTPDLLLLQNINWKNFVGEWSVNNVDWTTITDLNYASGVADNAATDIIINPSDIVDAKYIRFRVLKTLVADQAKTVGGIIACLGAIQPAGGFLKYKVENREAVAELMLGDKTISREYTFRSATSYEFWGASFELPVLTTAELATMRTIKRAGEPFILIPEPGDNKRDAFQCHFDGKWSHSYENPVRSIGYRLKMKVKEVGSH